MRLVIHLNFLAVLVLKVEANMSIVASDDDDDDDVH